MAFVQSDLDAIETAIATGAKKVQFQTHSVEYQSVSDMLRARDLIKAELSPSTAPPRVTVAKFYRGLSNR